MDRGLRGVVDGLEFAQFAGEAELIKLEQQAIYIQRSVATIKSRRESLIERH